MLVVFRDERSMSRFHFLFYKICVGTYHFMTIQYNSTHGSARPTQRRKSRVPAFLSTRCMSTIQLLSSSQLINRSHH